MAELRAWVLAQLLWNPQQDDKALIKEFLEGYYGKSAAQPIYAYLELMHEASKGVSLRCFLSRENRPYLNFSSLSKAERLWQQAEEAARGDSEKLLHESRICRCAARFRSWSLAQRMHGTKKARGHCRNRAKPWPKSFMRLLRACPTRNDPCARYE